MSDLPLPSCCPICDNAIQDYEPAGLYMAHGCKSLACQACLDEIEENDDFEDDEEE